MSGVLSLVGGLMASMEQAIKIHPYIEAGIITVAFVGVGYIMFRRYKNRIQYRVQSHPPSEIMSEAQSHIPDITDWKPLQISDQDLQEFDAITSEEYEEQIKGYICNLTRQVMREPCLLLCCATPSEIKRAEKCMITMSTKCPYCRQRLMFTQDRNTVKAIEYFRIRIRKLMRSLEDRNEIKSWAEKIQLDFGKDYVKNFL